MKEDFRDEISPNRDELIIDGDDATVSILDAEWDEIQCSFNGDGCVTIDTEELSYICLTIENLRKLKELIIETEIYFNNKKL
jgi:hypothetical protein